MHRDQILKIAQEKDFIKQSIPTHFFTLTSFHNLHKIKNTTIKTNNLKNKLIIVYLEGDGHSRHSKYELSNDPTPYQPLALELALIDSRPYIIYIARPGQYTPRCEDPKCNAKYWSTHRFSKEVIDSTNEAIDQILKNHGIKSSHHNSIQLIGFSGGGGLAVLVAAQRQDIDSIITVAGDLNPVAMTAYHKTMPLVGSLNPIGFVSKVSHIPQLHLVGTKDTVVPSFIADGYLKAAQRIDKNHKIMVMPIKADHHKGWVEQWPDIMKAF